MSATKGIRWRMAAVAALMAALLTLAWAASAEAQEPGWDCRQYERINAFLQETHPAEAGGLQELCRSMQRPVSIGIGIKWDKELLGPWHQQVVSFYYISHEKLRDEFDNRLENVYPEDMTLMGQALTFGDPKLIEDAIIPATATTYIDVKDLEEGETGEIWYWLGGYPTRGYDDIKSNSGQGRAKAYSINIQWPLAFMARDAIGETWDTHRPGLTRRVQTNPTAAPQPQEPTSTPAEPKAETRPTAAPDEQTNEQPTATGAEELTPPSRFVLTAEPRDGELQPGEAGAITLTATNPVGNSTDMELVLTLAAADGLEITDPSGQFDPRTGTAVYTAAPGAEAAVRLDVSATAPGRYTVTGRAEYRRRGGETAGFVELNHTFVVTAPPETDAGADKPGTPADADPQTGAGEQPAPNGNGGGCAMGSPDSGTDLSAVVLGGAMLAGLGMMLVRRRRDQS